MKSVPTLLGSNWRNMPNESLTLSNGIQISKLVYFYCANNSEDNIKRGVCPCCIAPVGQVDCIPFINPMLIPCFCAHRFHTEKYKSCPC